MIKLVSKSVLSALVGIAIDKGVLTSADKKIAPLMAQDIPEMAGVSRSIVTIGNLLSTQSGLSRTSGRNYGRFVTNKNWVRYVRNQPFVDQPGGCMLYSTGNYHVVSALLTKVTGKSTHELARDWLGKPLGIKIPAW